MLRINYVTIAAAYVTGLLLTGCGSSSGGNNAKSVAAPNSTTESIEDKAIAETPSHALAVAELPECSEANLHQLVYLTSKSQFYTCEGDWQPIDISVEQKVIAPEKSFLWFDEVTGRYWFIKDPAPSYLACPDSGSSQIVKTFENPNTDEIQEALANGMFEVKVKVYLQSGLFVYSDDPYTLLHTADYTGNIHAFTACLIVEE